jgi:hypothetical protein
MITLPANMSLTDWADQVCLDLDRYGVVGKIMSEDWQGWGSQLANNISIGGNLPDPYSFDDWQIWGQRLCEALR